MEGAAGALRAAQGPPAVEGLVAHGAGAGRGLCGAAEGGLRGEGELVHEEERIVAGSYFISAEDGGEEEARADDHPGNVDNDECVLDREP